MAQNTRLTQIQKFLAKPPARAKVLRVLLVGNPPSVVYEQDLPCVPALAAELESTLEEMAEASGVRETRFVLQYFAADSEDQGPPLPSLRVMFRVASGSVDVFAEAQGLDGSPQSILVQHQKHMEFFTRSYIGAHQTQIQQYQTLVASADERAARAEARLETAQQEMNELRRKAADAEAAAQQAIQDMENASAEAGEEPMSEAQKQAIALFQQALPGLMMRFLAPNAGPSGPVRQRPQGPQAPAPAEPGEPATETEPAQ